MREMWLNSYLAAGRQYTAHAADKRIAKTALSPLLPPGGIWQKCLFFFVSFFVWASKRKKKIGEQSYSRGRHIRKPLRKKNRREIPNTDAPSRRTGSSFSTPVTKIYFSSTEIFYFCPLKGFRQTDEKGTGCKSRTLPDAVSFKMPFAPQRHCF